MFIINSIVIMINVVCLLIIIYTVHIICIIFLHFHGMAVGFYFLFLFSIYLVKQDANEGKKIWK